MLICPSCHQSEIEGAMFCSECGTQLNWVGILASSSPEDQLSSAAVSSNKNDSTKPNKIPLRKKAKHVFSLFLMDHNKVFNIDEEMDITLGRGSVGQPILPDIDLSPYNAFELGVSRLHASINIINHQLFVADLGSANGTYVNGNRVLPRTEQILNHRDILKLGKLKMQVIISKYETIH